MTNNYIQLKDLLEQMNQLDENNMPKSFQIKFVTADRGKKTGGEIIEIPSAKRCVGYRNGKLVFDSRESSSPTTRKRRDPNHWANSTRNLLLPNKQIRTIHIRLIIEFNNQKVFF